MKQNVSTHLPAAVRVKEEVPWLSSFFLLKMPITLPYALWKLTMRKKMTCKRQNSSFLSNKYTFQAIIHNVTNTKSELWKTVRLTSFKKLPIPILFCPFVPSFVLNVLLMYSLLKCFERLLLLLLLLFKQFGASSYC